MANCCEISAQLANGMVHFYGCCDRPDKRAFPKLYHLAPLVFGYLPDLTVIPLYRIGCVDQFPDHGRILEIFGKAFPIVSPKFDDNITIIHPY